MTAASLANAFPVYDFETYLGLEAIAGNRNEFFHGHIYAIAGGELNHDTIKMSAYLIFGAKLAKSACFMTSSDFMIATQKRDAAFYPNMAIHCHPRPNGKITILEAPSLILEVLSPSTRRYDLNAKRKEYFRIPSLRHYLLLDSQSMSAMLYTRDDNQTWPKDPHIFTDPKSTIPLTALKLSLNLKDLYRQTTLP